MRSTSENVERCNRKRGYGHRDPEPDSVKEVPQWIMVEGGKSGTVADLFTPALNRVYKAIERDIKDVCKNKI